MPPVPPGEGGWDQSRPFIYPPIPPRTRDELPPTGHGAIAPPIKRAVALIIDYILVTSILYGPVIAPHVKTKNKQLTLNLPVSAEIILWAVPVVYAAICIAFRGQTIGGWIMAVRVVRYVDGGPVAPYQALIRALLPALPSLVASGLPSSIGGVVQLLQIVIYLSIFFDPLQRGFHDKASGTIVIRSR
jgi:uncharacterized RDD family membrane protein YckC